MTKFMILALLFSLFAPNATVNALPSVINNLSSGHSVPMLERASTPELSLMTTDCVQSCQESSANHCQIHCTAPPYLVPAGAIFTAPQIVSSDISIQSWAASTVILNLTIPPPNSSSR
ncbi:MAG: hypothetical protein ACRCVV_15050 [Shewanella sp.]